MFNLLYILYNHIISFNFHNFLINKVLYYVTVFQFINLVLLLLLFIYYIYNKYKIKIKIITMMIIKKAILGFFFTFLIYLASNKYLCNNSLNDSICTNYLDTDFKIKIMMGILILVGGIGIYKVGSTWYYATMNQNNIYLKKKNIFYKEQDTNNLFKQNYLDMYKQYEFNFINYKNLLLKYNNDILLKKEDEIKLLDYNKKIKINEFLENASNEILEKFNDFKLNRKLDLEITSNKYKHIYIFNNMINDLKNNKIIDHPINNLELMYRGVFNPPHPTRIKLTKPVIQKLNNLNEEIDFQQDILSLSNRINLLELEFEYTTTNKFQNIVISSTDITDIENNKIMGEIMNFSKSRINNISDSYIIDRIKSTETLFTFTNTANKFKINFNEVNILKKDICQSITKLNNSYNELCHSSLELNNFIGSDIEFNNLLKQNFLKIDSHNLVWRELLQSINSYNLYLKSIPTEALIFPEALITWNLIEPIKPIEPTEPIYTITFKSIENIPKIDITGSYFLGLKFASVNAGYVVLYPTFSILNFFLGIGNPIPSELFYESLKYFYKLKMFYGK